jgi:hypothetical protein
MRASGWEAALPGAPSIGLVAVVVLAAVVGPTHAEGAQGTEADVDALHAAALSAIARARAAGGSDVVRQVSLPSIERLVEDADLRRAKVTTPARDGAFVRDTLAGSPKGTTPTPRRPASW